MFSTLANGVDAASHDTANTTARAFDDNHPLNLADAADARVGLAPLVIAGSEENSEHNRRSEPRQKSRSEAVAWDRQARMWDVTQDKNLRGCHRWARGSAVSGVHTQGGDAGRIMGLQNTKSKTGSPVAALSIAQERKVEMGISFKNWMAEFGHVLLFIVLTVPHHRGQSCEEVLAGLKAGYRAATVGRMWKEDREQFGVAHLFSDYEWTWSTDNGHHPHKNAIGFGDRVLSEDELDALQARLYGRYRQGVLRAGLDAPHPEYGLKIVQITSWGTDAATTAGYITKGSFDLAAEVTSQATKTAADGHFTPGELLDELTRQKLEEGQYTPQFLAAYRDYEHSFKGLRSSWSRGAKKALRIDFISEEDREAMEDELRELAGIETIKRDKGARTAVVMVHAREWSKISANIVARQRFEDALVAPTPEDAQRQAGQVLDELGVGWSPVMFSVDDDDQDDDLPTHPEATARDLRATVLA